MTTEIMEALELGLEKYFGKIKIPKLWDKEEVCYYLKVSRSVFDKSIRESEGFQRPRKIGDSLRWKPSEVEEWSDRQRVLKVGRKRA